MKIWADIDAAVVALFTNILFDQISYSITQLIIRIINRLLDY